MGAEGAVFACRWGPPNGGTADVGGPHFTTQERVMQLWREYGQLMRVQILSDFNHLCRISRHFLPPYRHRARKRPIPRRHRRWYPNNHTKSHPIVQKKKGENFWLIRLTVPSRGTVGASSSLCLRTGISSPILATFADIPPRMRPKRDAVTTGWGHPRRFEGKCGEKADGGYDSCVQKE